MFNLNQLVRPNILVLDAYSSAREEFTGKEGVFLDANENPFGSLNRYPDPQQQLLKAQLANMKAVKTSNIFIGNGSDEIIDLALRIFCEPSVDCALTFTPTYGMYEVSANINAVQLIQVPLNEQFDIEMKGLAAQLSDERLKLVFLCSPNNPTGNTLKSEAIEFILDNFNGIIIIDEAYIDFSDQPSWITAINQYPNLIISQTFSKAWGLAAARVGVAYANEQIIELFNKVKPPYNISQLNQNAALNALQEVTLFEKNRAAILAEKERLINQLSQLEFIQQVYHSDTNFILIKVANANAIYNALTKQKVIIRNRHKVVNNCLRISIGTKIENDELLAQLQILNRQFQN